MSYFFLSITVGNLITAGVNIFMHKIDGANYFYLFRPPSNTGNPLILAEKFPLYFINMEVVAIIVLAIIYIPMIIYREKIDY